MIDQASGSPVYGFRITAVPQIPGRTGNRGFCSTEPGVITADPAGGTSCSAPIT
jgi:type IV pilus assembly protein PilA